MPVSGRVRARRSSSPSSASRAPSSRSRDRGAGDARRARARSTRRAARSHPADVVGHDHLWWLDRMVRTTTPLIERMTLIWHSWFATSNQGVASAAADAEPEPALPRERARLVRRPAHGRDDRPGDARLAEREPEREGPPERELRSRDDGALHARRRPRRLHRDRRPRAGARAHRLERVGRRRASHRRSRSSTAGTTTRTRRSSGRPATGTGRTPATSASTTRCTRRSSSTSSGATSSRRRSTRPPSTGLQALYSGRQIRPVVEAILMHPAFYTGPRMIKPPVVYNAGLLRMRGPEHRHARSGGRSASRPASSSSTRRTSAAGTTRAGSTRRRSARAGSSRRIVQGVERRRRARPSDPAKLDSARRPVLGLPDDLADDARRC